MKIVTLIRAELARVTSSRMGLIALVALMLVPIVYGALYLWGNQDPYNSLDKVPAALVVDDSGSTVNGAAVNYGRDAANQLIADHRFAWVEVDDAVAQAGVASGRFDFAVTFPAPFSADLASAGGSTPTQASLALTTSDTNSYLSTTLAKQAAQTLRTTLAQQLAGSASRTLLDAVDSIRGGLVRAGDGAAKLASGAADAAAGAATLATGTQQLASGAVSLDAGAAQLSSGAAAAASGATTLGGVTAQAAALAPQALANVQAALTAAGVSLADQAPILTQLQGLTQLTAGANQGAGRLSSSLGQLSAGASQVASGAASVSSGAASAASGAGSLASGTAQLSDGATQLHASLTDGVAKVPATTAEQRAASAAAIRDPVAVQQTALTEAQNYGAGLAPFFISLSAWIGVYALFLILRPLSRRAVTATHRPIRTTLAGWLTPTLLGALQMIGLFLVLTLALHLQPVNALGMLGFMALISATFAAIVLALNVWLGSTGQFLALILMVVQLVTAGGTFPWQTLPAPLAALHQALPMSHAVEGVRVLLYGGTGAALVAALLPLLGWLAAGLVVSALGALKQGRYRTVRELRPSPVGG